MQNVYTAIILDGNVKLRKCFPHYWPFVWGIHQWLVDSPYKRPVMQSFNDFFDVSWNKQMVNLPMIYDSIAFIWHPCNDTEWLSQSNIDDFSFVGEFWSVSCCKIFNSRSRRNRPNAGSSDQFWSSPGMVTDLPVLYTNMKAWFISTHWGPDKMDAIFANILKCIFLNANTIWISIKFSLKFVGKGPIDNIYQRWFK